MRWPPPPLHRVRAPVPGVNERALTGRSGEGFCGELFEESPCRHFAQAAVGGNTRGTKRVGVRRVGAVETGS